MPFERVLGRAILSGTVASLTSVAVLAAASRLERGSAPQALNATSHWWHGDRAARVRRLDVAHTGTGYLTHWVATIFWATFFETWQASRPQSLDEGGGDLGTRTTRASAVAGLAVVVDYTITPHRFTPGWELVISKGSMALVYAAMAAGFVLVS